MSEIRASRNPSSSKASRAAATNADRVLRPRDVVGPALTVAAREPPPPPAVLLRARRAAGSAELRDMATSYCLELRLAPRQPSTVRYSTQQSNQKPVETHCSASHRGCRCTARADARSAAKSVTRPR